VVAQAKTDHPSVRIIAIVNPGDGAGMTQNSTYVRGIQGLKSSGVAVIGYLATNYAGRDTGDAKAEIDNYKNWYNVDGVFLDQMSYWAGDESYYSDLNDYAKSQGLAIVIGNPGTDTEPSYVGTVDAIIIHEDPGLPPISFLAGWHTNYDKQNWGILPYGIESLNEQYVSRASNYVGYIGIGNGTNPSAWGALPLYFGSLVALLDPTAPPPTPPDPPTGLATAPVSYSRIQLNWTAPARDGGSPVRGYEVDRSADDGVTWSTVVWNTGTTAVTYTDKGLISNTTYSYRVSAINSVGTGSPSDAASGTTLVRLYLVVQAADLSGNALPGFWAELYSSDGKLIAGGYTPLTFSVSYGKNCVVFVGNYQNFVFDHWDGGSTSPYRTLTPTGNMTLTAYFAG
jgi:hypothetical protein